MRFVVSARLIVAGWLVSGCGSSHSDCTCRVENDGQRRSLVCGETACVGGTVLSCTQQGTSVQRGPCAPPPQSSNLDAGVLTGGQPGVADASCQNLAEFCSTSCVANLSAFSDCQNTANSGDVVACASWQLTNGVLCSP